MLINISEMRFNLGVKNWNRWNRTDPYLMDQNGWLKQSKAVLIQMDKIYQKSRNDRNKCRVLKFGLYHCTAWCWSFASSLCNSESQLSVHWTLLRAHKPWVKPALGLVTLYQWIHERYWTCATNDHPKNLFAKRRNLLSKERYPNSKSYLSCLQGLPSFLQTLQTGFETEELDSNSYKSSDHVKRLP